MLGSTFFTADKGSLGQGNVFVRRLSSLLSTGEGWLNNMDHRSHDQGGLQYFSSFVVSNFRNEGNSSVNFSTVLYTWVLSASHSVADPTVQNFLDFMQFFGNFDKIIYIGAPWGLPPPTGNPESASSIALTRVPLISHGNFAAFG